MTLQRSLELARGICGWSARHEGWDRELATAIQPQPSVPITLSAGLRGRASAIADTGQTFSQGFLFLRPPAKPLKTWWAHKDSNLGPAD